MGGADEVRNAADSHAPLREDMSKLQDAKTLGLSDALEQVAGQPWNYQQKFDPKMFFKGVEWSPSIYELPKGVCDL